MRKIKKGPELPLKNAKIDADGRLEAAMRRGGLPETEGEGAEGESDVG
jgi:hypothetical protein